MEDRIYHIVANGQQAGPFTLSELASKGITPDTLVWKPGMADWKEARYVDDFAAFFPPEHNQGNRFSNGYNQGGYGNNNGYNNGYNNSYNNGFNNGYNNVPGQHYDWSTLGIIAIVAGFLVSCIGGIFGIIGYNAATKANRAYAAGDDITGDSANSQAKTMIIIAFVLVGIGLITNIAMFTSGGLAGLMSF